MLNAWASFPIPHLAFSSLAEAVQSPAASLTSLFPTDPEENIEAVLLSSLDMLLCTERKKSRWKREEITPGQYKLCTNSFSWIPVLSTRIG